MKKIPLLLVLITITVFGQNRPRPVQNEININNVENNEFLAIRTTGAYSSVMSSNYNARSNANEVFIYNNKDYLIKETESIEKLIKKEKLVEFN